ncbi:MAG: Gfo/Idh/MocA family protein, partial [Spirochaetota bacterium]
GLAHCAGYLRSSEANLYAVCDAQPERLTGPGGTFDQGSMPDLKTLFSETERAASWEDLGVRTYQSLDEVLADPEIDMVSVCTPDYQHGEQALQVLEAGKHLLLEKPIALTRGAAAAVVAAGRDAEKRGIRAAVGYEFRVNPAVTAVRELVQSFTGTVRAFSLYHFRTPFKRDKWNQWIQREELSGGLIVEETSHWVDLARFIPRLEVSEVQCVTVDDIHRDFDYEDVAYINGRYENGGILQLSHALTGFDFNLTIQVHGTDGTVWCGLKDAPYTSLDYGQAHHLGLVAWGTSSDSPEDAHVRTFGPEVTEPESIRAYTEHFARTVEYGGAVACSLEDAQCALEISLDARESARQGGTPVAPAAAAHAGKRPDGARSPRRAPPGSPSSPARDGEVSKERPT